MRSNEAFHCSDARICIVIPNSGPLSSNAPVDGGRAASGSCLPSKHALSPVNTQVWQDFSVPAQHEHLHSFGASWPIFGLVAGGCSQRYPHPGYAQN